MLRVVPICYDANLPAQSIRHVECPLQLSLGDDVVYELVGRVIHFEGGLGHFKSQIRIEDLVYQYDDMANDGKLSCIGPLHELEKFHPGTVNVFYTRKSIQSVSQFIMFVSFY